MNKKDQNGITMFHPGYYIKEVIEDIGITQKDFAKSLGVSPKTVSNLINGKCKLSPAMAYKLSAALGIGVNVWLNLQKKYEQEIENMT